MSCAETIRVVGGPRGRPGTDGDDGSAGLNAFTLTTAPFFMPAIGGSVDVSVEETDWVSQAEGSVPGQVFHVQFAGHMSVVTVVDGTTVTLENLGYDGNAPPGTNIPTASKVSPAGLQGPAGADGVTPTLDDIAPTVAKGDMIVHDGTDNEKLAVGADGTRPVADAAQALGVKWDKVNLNVAAEVNGVLAIANGGTAGANAADAAAALGVLPLLGGTLTGDLRMLKATPKLWINNSSGAADEKKAYLQAITTLFQLFLVNDAEAVANAVWSVLRSGATPTLFRSDVDFRAAEDAEFIKQVRYSMGINTALANGSNNNVSFADLSFVKIKTGPSGAFTITGIAGGASGRRLLLYNATSQAMTLGHENVLSDPSNRILAMTGSDVVTTTNGTAELIYDDDAQRWIIHSQEV